MNRTIRRLAVLLVAFVAAFVGTGLGSAAQAVQLYGASGSPGSISPYTVKATTVNTCQMGTCYQRQVQVAGPTVGKSPSSNASQDLRIQYRLYRWNGSAWALQSSVNRNYSMGYNSAVRLPGINFNVSAGHYYVEESLSWHLSTNQMTLGTRGVSFNGNDYYCSGSQLSCGASTGYVTFG